MHPGIRIGIPSPETGAGFSPSQLSGLVLWLRSDMGITLNGSNVSAWADQSGNGNHVSQGTAANQPPYAASGGPNNYPFIGPFDGVNDDLTGSFTWGQPADVFVVAKDPLTGAPTGLIDGTTVNTRLIFNASGVSGSYRMHAGVTFGAGTYITTAFHRFRAGFNGASSKWSVDDEATQTGDAGSAAASGITIGRRPGDQQSQCSVCEVIGYSRILSVAEVTEVQDYLKGRYGI